MASKFQSVKGMHDLLPSDQVAFRLVRETFARLAEDAGFAPIETPILEQKALFVRGVHEGTDIVDKEMYTLTDKSGEDLALRPEGSASVARAYTEHGMNSWPQPVKLYYTGPMFRYDRPQAGRTRQHHQVGVELMGEAKPSADAQTITLATRLFKRLEIHDFTLAINSIGDSTCRPKYRKALVEYLEANKKELCENCQDRIKKNPLRVLDCKGKSCQAVIAGAPQTLNYLCKDCHSHFTGVLEYLDDLGVDYVLTPTLVRGLDYYNRTVFEFQGAREGAQASLGGGGRYDGLIEELGGRSTPAVGFGIGIERLILEMGEAAKEIKMPNPVKIFVASLGEPARLAAFKLGEQLLDAGIGAVTEVNKDGLASQLGRADRLGVPYALIIGQKEVLDKTVILRDMGSGAQEVLPHEKIVTELQTRFN